MTQTKTTHKKTQLQTNRKVFFKTKIQNKTDESTKSHIDNYQKKNLK